MGIIARVNALSYVLNHEHTAHRTIAIYESKKSARHNFAIHERNIRLRDHQPLYTFVAAPPLLQTLSVQLLLTDFSFKFKELGDNAEDPFS